MLLAAIPIRTQLDSACVARSDKVGQYAESPTSPLVLALSSENELEDQNSSTSETIGAEWGPRDSERLYGTRNWGHPYFSVNDLGHVSVSPNGGTVLFSQQTPELQIPCLVNGYLALTSVNCTGP